MMNVIPDVASGDVIVVGGITYTLDKLLYSRKGSWLFTAYTNASEQFVLKRVPKQREKYVQEIEINNVIAATSVPNCLHIVTSILDCEYDILVFPYVECGDLWTQVQYFFPRGMDERQTRHVLNNVLTGLLALKELTIVHHDVSLENMLVADDGSVLLCDFGLSVFEQDVKSASVPREFVQGKLNYIAPELYFKPNRFHDLYTADVWSLGVCAFMLLTGEMPYFNIGDDSYDDLVLYGARVVLTEKERRIRRQISPEAKELLCKMLTLDPRKRVHLEDVCSQPFFTGSKLPSAFWKKVTDCLLQTVRWFCPPAHR